LGEASEVVYDKKHWKLLKEIRRKASAIIEAVSGLGPKPVIHGSVARGDVDEKSDVDVFLPGQLPSYKVELALRDAGFRFWKREIVMATPWQLPKAHVYLEERESVTFPLVKPKRLELDFYRFGGTVGREDLEKELRVPGVDKRLMLIQPTQKGHSESHIVGREAEIADLLDVSMEIVRERVQVLSRRAEVGRTGIFIQRSLAPEEHFEDVFRKLIAENPSMRIGLKGRFP
jgi:hypothetical protein